MLLRCHLHAALQAWFRAGSSKNSQPHCSLIDNKPQFASEILAFTLYFHFSSRKVGRQKPRERRVAARYGVLGACCFSFTRFFIQFLTSVFYFLASSSLHAVMSPKFAHLICCTRGGDEGEIIFDGWNFSGQKKEIPGGKVRCYVLLTFARLTVLITYH